jgi:sortase A
MSLHERGPMAVAVLLGVMGMQQLGNAGYIQAKANFAQFLIAQAWSKTVVQGGGRERPWPWADTWPVARLQVPELAVDLYVLEGSSGNALAFGPGFDVASVAPGEDGVSVIAGHRDTHFGFLRHVEAGTPLRLQRPNGEIAHYAVVDAEVVNTQQQLFIPQASSGSELLLVTCYPFDAINPGGPLRYLVRARKQEVYAL